MFSGTVPRNPGDFNPRSPCGERRSPSRLKVSVLVFQSTLPVWGATETDHRSGRGVQISIHAPRVGSDTTPAPAGRRYPDFNPRSPCGERHTGPPGASCTDNFNPRSPCGERPTARSMTCSPPRFQSTLPVWGATCASAPVPVIIVISIHAPRVGSDSAQLHRTGNPALNFNPRSPCGERRTPPGGRIVDSAHFNPRSPCGERPAGLAMCTTEAQFQSTLPVWGATAMSRMETSLLSIFQSTLPVWGATLPRARLL